MLEILVGFMVIFCVIVGFFIIELIGVDFVIWVLGFLLACYLVGTLVVEIFKGGI